jgi:hypothetical protein
VLPCCWFVQPTLEWHRAVWCQPGNSEECGKHGLKHSTPYLDKARFFLAQAEKAEAAAITGTAFLSLQISKRQLFKVDQLLSIFKKNFLIKMRF